MQRHLLGLIALACLVSGFVSWRYVGIDQGDKSMASSVFIRAGLVLGAIWLALPQLFSLVAKYPLWVMLTGAGLLGTLIIQPRLFPVAFGLAIVITIVQTIRWLFAPLPRKPKAKQDPDRGRSR